MSDDETGQPRRVLLDENLHRKLSRELPGHAVSTVASEGWRSLRNGDLLRRAEAAGFDVFVTADRNLQYQQTLAGRTFGTVVLYPRRLKLEELLPLVPALRQAVAVVAPGQILHVYPPAQPLGA